MRAEPYPPKSGETIAAPERFFWDLIWDEGTADVLREESGHLSFRLDGHKLAGRFGLTRTGERRWILVKAGDEYARPGSDVVAQAPASVRTGRTWQEVAAEPWQEAAVEDDGAGAA